jgi:hypothetical protein
MKRLSILVGLAMLAFTTPSEAACNNWDTECLKREAAQGQQGWPKEMPAECTGYGAANTKPAHCAQWEGWQPGMPPPGQGGQQGTGGWTPPPGQQQPPPGQTTGTQQPPPGGWQPNQVMCPANSVWDVQAQRCLFKKADTGTQQKCRPGYVAMLYGNSWTCVPRKGTTTGQSGVECQPGWVYSQAKYRCVPGVAPPPKRVVCGYGKVWSDQYGKCVRFGGGTDGAQASQGGYGCKQWERWSNRQQTCVPKRQGGGTYGDQGGGWQQGSQGGYGCGPYERWSNSRQTCVPRRGGGGDTYGSAGSTYGGSQGIPGINIYIGGGKKKRGGDDYGNRGGGGDYGYRGSGGNDYRGRGR